MEIPNEFVGEDGLPRHLPMGVNAEGQGPTNDGDEVFFECWCPDPECWWTRTFRRQRELGIAEGQQQLVKAVKEYVSHCQDISWPVTARALLQMLEGWEERD